MRLHACRQAVNRAYRWCCSNPRRGYRRVEDPLIEPDEFLKALSEINHEISSYKGQGTVASYIPELYRVDPMKFGLHVRSTQGNCLGFGIGDNDEKFSIQSISKVLALALASSKVDTVAFNRVGVEPSGNPFNSLIQLEQEKGIPRNPFINAGAIVLCDILMDQHQNPKEAMLEFCRLMSRNDCVDFNEQVAASEEATGFRNYALANFMKSYGNLHHNVNDVLDLYFHICSIEMSCRDLANCFSVFANEGLLLPPGSSSSNSSSIDGVSVGSKFSDHGAHMDSKMVRILPSRHVSRINAVMQTCGFYDEAGEFAFRIGLPGKSGVGGA